MLSVDPGLTIPFFLVSGSLPLTTLHMKAIYHFSIFGIHDNPVLFVNLRLMLIEDTKLHKFSKNGKNNRNVCQLKASLGVEFSD